MLDLICALQSHFTPSLYPVVLVGSDRDEACFWEGEGAKVALGIAVTVAPRVHQHHVQTWLVAMHGVQDDLRGQT